MQIHELKGNTTSKKRVARGGKRGTTSGRGTKGQTARSGGRRRPGFEGGRTSLAKLTPKLRGSGSGMGARRNRKLRVLRVDRIIGFYNDGDTVSPDSLVANGVLRGEKSRFGLRVKIVGAPADDFVIDKKLTFENCELSNALTAAVESAGGTVVPAEREAEVVAS